MSSLPLKMLYATREKHPCTRVDLTDLFSGHLVADGVLEVDWVMQGFDSPRSHVETLSDSERVFVGASASGSGMMAKAGNHFLALGHDLRIWWLAGRRRYDIIQVRDKFFGALVALLAARYRGSRFVYWCSFPYAEADLNRVESIGSSLSAGYRLFYRLRGWFTGWLLYSIILPRADHIFVQSERMMQDMAASGAPAGRMTPVPMGVSLERIEPEKGGGDDLPELSGKMAVVYMGTMVRLRGLDFLIEAFVPVAKRFPEVVLLMVGGGSESDMRFLREAAEKNGVADRVVFTGQLPMQKAWEYVRASKACLSLFKPNPILDSTSPTKVVEYLALERPVVVNDHPDQATVINESGGGVVTPYDPEAFGEGIIRLLAEPEQSVRMGKAGREYVSRKRSYSAIARDVAEVYRSIDGGSPENLKLKRAD